MAEITDIRTAEIAVKRWLTMPTVVVLVLFSLAPLVVVLVYSFLAPNSYGGVLPQFSLDAYVSLLFQKDIFDGTLTFSPEYISIFGNTLKFGLISTLVCLVIGFPTAYFMATRPPETRNRWVLIVTIPFWSNLLVRTIAVMFIIREEGMINTVLLHLGIIQKPLVMLFTDFAVVLGLFYSFLPFMILPIYASLEKFDFRLAEAAYDLYATRTKVLFRIIIPLAMPGIVTGCLLVFIPSFGAYLTPLILGGGKHMMIGDLIALQFGSSRNWPLGSAFAVVLMTVILLALIVYVRKSGEVRHG